MTLTFIRGVCVRVCVRVRRVQINHASDCSITIEMHVPRALLPHARGEPQIELISCKLFRSSWLFFFFLGF